MHPDNGDSLGSENRLKPYAEGLEELRKKCDCESCDCEEANIYYQSNVVSFKGLNAFLREIGDSFFDIKRIDKTDNYSDPYIFLVIYEVEV